MVSSSAETIRDIVHDHRHSDDELDRMLLGLIRVTQSTSTLFILTHRDTDGHTYLLSVWPEEAGSKSQEF